MKNRELNVGAGVINIEAFKPEPGYVLCLKYMQPSLKAYNGFKWPKIGHVTAPDWKPTKKIGNGLHAFMWGEGYARFGYLDDDAMWLVLKVRKQDIVELDGMVKFPEAEVLFCGEKEIAVSIVMHHAPAGTSVVFANITVGDDENAFGGDHANIRGGNFAKVRGGDFATLIVGDYGTAIGSYHATITGGYFANLTGGQRSTVKGGHRSTVKGGKWAKVFGGNYADVTGGDLADVTGGDYADVTGGDYAKVWGGNNANVRGGAYANLTGGDYATVSGGVGAKVSGGKGAVLILEYSEESKNKRKSVVVDGEKILPGVKYRLNDAHEFVPFEGR
jgi:hypothetical protein